MGRHRRDERTIETTSGQPQPPTWAVEPTVPLPVLVSATRLVRRYVLTPRPRRR